MSTHASDLLEEALSLPAPERSAMVAALLDSLKDNQDAAPSGVWREELMRRRHALQNKELRVVPWMEAKARLRAV